MSVCVYVGTYVHTSVRPQKVSLISITSGLYVDDCRRQRMIHDGMQYDLIQGQGHDLLKVGNPFIFKSYLLCHLQW